MKTVGIIGGFGPKTTSEFFMMLLFLWNKRNNKERPEILISNSPVNIKEEFNFIRRGTSSSHFLPLLIKAAIKLEKSGADFLVLPCNSLHIFLTDVQKSVKIPVISILDVTTNRLAKIKVKSIGLLGNQTTINKQLFDEHFNKKGIKILTPQKLDQKKLNRIINKIVNNEISLKEQKDFIDIVKKLNKQKINNILLACTDLQLLNPKVKGIRFFDTLDLLAKKTVEMMAEE